MAEPSWSQIAWMVAENQARRTLTDRSPFRDVPRRSGNRVGRLNVLLTTEPSPRVGLVRGQAEQARQRRPEPARRHAADLDLVGAHELGQRAQRLYDTRERFVLIDSFPAARRGPRRSEPGLEVHVTSLQTALGAMALGVDAADEMTMVEDWQRVVAVHALGPGRVDLDAVVEAEQPRHPVAMPEQRIEGCEKRCFERGSCGPPGAGQR